MFLTPPPSPTRPAPDPPGAPLRQQLVIDDALLTQIINLSEFVRYAAEGTKDASHGNGWTPVVDTAVKDVLVDVNKLRIEAYAHKTNQTGVNKKWVDEWVNAWERCTSILATMVIPVYKI
jgi:hypothetical protein